MTLHILKQLAKALSVQFGSNCEVVIHDLTKKSLQKSLVYIENGQVTNRRTGDGPSHIVLETLKKDPAKIQDHLGYLTRTKDGKTLRSSTIFIREAEGPVQYIIGINYDITDLLYLQNALSPLLSEGDSRRPLSRESQEPTQIYTNVTDLLEALIAQSVAMVGKPVSLMSKDDRMEAIRFLDNSGAFLITGSGDKVSSYFGISKYTLYSYLKSDEP